MKLFDLSWSRRLAILLPVILLLVPVPAAAEFRRIELRISGMD